MSCCWKQRVASVLKINLELVVAHGVTFSCECENLKTLALVVKCYKSIQGHWWSG